jgi:hypothetical protein
MSSNNTQKTVMSPTDYDYLENLIDTESCVTMPSPYKPIPRNDNQQYNTYIKNVVVRNISPAKTLHTNQGNTIEPRFHRNRSEETSERMTHQHPEHKNMVCVVGFEPGPPRPLGKPINEHNYFPTTLRELQQKTSTQTTQDDKPFPLTQLTNPSQVIHLKDEHVDSENPFEHKHPAAAKPPPFLYPNEIVDTFNNAVFEAATESNIVQKLTEFTEYEDCNRIVTTTYLFNPFHREEIEDKLNIKIADKRPLKRPMEESKVDSKSPTPKRVCIVTTAWRDESQTAKHFR